MTESSEPRVRLQHEYIHEELGRIIPLYTTIGWAESPHPEDDLDIIVFSYVPNGTNFGPYTFHDLRTFETETELNNNL